mgnify:CR=1 FL=1
MVGVWTLSNGVSTHTVGAHTVEETADIYHDCLHPGQDQQSNVLKRYQNAAPQGEIHVLGTHEALAILGAPAPHTAPAPRRQGCWFLSYLPRDPKEASITTSG